MSILQWYKVTKPTDVHLNLIPKINSHSTLPFPALKSKATMNPGYQEAHQLYNEMHDLFHNKAYTNSANAELVIVRVWMMVRVPNHRTPAPISVLFFFVLCIQVLTWTLPKSTQDICESLSEIPVHIGAEDLKWVLYHALLPQYIKQGIPTMTHSPNWDGDTLGSKATHIGL